LNFATPIIEMALKWIEALKIWNAKHNPGKWCVARKGSPEYDQVRAIMRGEAAPAPAAEKPTTKKFLEKLKAKKAEKEEADLLKEIDELLAADKPKAEPKPEPKKFVVRKVAKKTDAPKNEIVGEPEKPEPKYPRKLTAAEHDLINKIATEHTQKMIAHDKKKALVKEFLRQLMAHRREVKAAKASEPKAPKEMSDPINKEGSGNYIIPFNEAKGLRPNEVTSEYYAARVLRTASDYKGDEARQRAKQLMEQFPKGFTYEYDKENGRLVYKAISEERAREIETVPLAERVKRVKEEKKKRAEQFERERKEREMMATEDKPQHQPPPKKTREEIEAEVKARIAAAQKPKAAPKAPEPPKEAPKAAEKHPVALALENATHSGNVVDRADFLSNLAYLTKRSKEEIQRIFSGLPFEFKIGDGVDTADFVNMYERHTREEPKEEPKPAEKAPEPKKGVKIPASWSDLVADEENEPFVRKMTGDFAIKVPALPAESKVADAIKEKYPGISNAAANRLIKGINEARESQRKEHGVKAKKEEARMPAEHPIQNTKLPAASEKAAERKTEAYRSLASEKKQLADAEAELPHAEGYRRGLLEEVIPALRKSIKKREARMKKGE